MVGNMIKVCSLNFLKEKYFKSDVMSADGTLLFNSGDEVTAEIILKLYFKDIYIEKPKVENEQEVVVEEAENLVSSGAYSSDLKNVSASSSGDFQANAIASGPRSIELDEKSSGPRFVDSIDVAPSETDPSKGPRFVDTNLDAMNGTKKNPYSSAINAQASGPEEETPVEDPENMPLVFDEDQAKRIVSHSAKLAKILNFSQKELKELEQAAYYCNIGISGFKKADLKNKEFRKMKAFASYKKLIDEATVPRDIAEIVKFCANDYSSESFPLDSKIPLQHVVAITSFYEDLLAKTNSKQDTLLKMLQLGGNHFNIFVLHKFIKLMRGDSE